MSRTSQSGSMKSLSQSGSSMLSAPRGTVKSSTTGETAIIPQATQQALQYLDSVVESVSEAEMLKLMFDDHLVTVSDTGKELGEFSISIDRVQRHGQICYLVHANSKGAVDGVPCGTSIVCYVSPTLETLEQHHHEFVKLEHQPLDRKTTITRNEEGYLVTKMVTQGSEMAATSKTFSLDTMKGFISEGSNMLLQRILIYKGLPEELQFISFDSEDTLCPAVYRTLEERTQKVEMAELRVLGVERTIDSKADLPTTWQSYFTVEGFLANRVQVGSPVTMTLEHMPVRKQLEDEPSKPVFGKKELNWEEDLQMSSAFLDRKEELKNSHMVFLRHHPELRALLADFMQFLLLSKPEDTLAFSADYFAAFSTTLKSSPCYIASAIPPLFPHCATNAKVEELRRLRLK